MRGQAGGRQTYKTHGKSHMQAIGRKGFTSFCDRYFAGDREAATSWLHRRAAEKVAATHADRILAERQAAGDRTASIELPVYETDAEVPF